MNPELPICLLEYIYFSTLNVSDALALYQPCQLWKITCYFSCMAKLRSLGGGGVGRGSLRIRLNLRGDIPPVEDKDA